MNISSGTLPADAPTRRRAGFYGISAYAGLHKEFPAERFMQQFPVNTRNPCIALLLGCFGWSPKLLELFMERFGAQRHLIEIHISNGASRRTPGRLGPGAYARFKSVKEFNAAWERGGNKALLSQLDNFFSKWEKILPVSINTTLLVSAELEDNLTDKAWMIFNKACKERFSPCTMVRSPCTGGGNYLKLKERHGLVYGLTRDNVGNLDGESINFNDGEDYFKTVSISQAKRYLRESLAKATFLWSATQQGIPKASDFNNWPAHKDRTFTVTNQAITGMRNILSDF